MTDVFGQAENSAGGDNRVVATAVPERLREEFLPFYLGSQFLCGEALVYSTLQAMSGDCDGGYWEFYMLSNGVFYMEPKADKVYRLQCPGNGFDGKVSADAAGIYATLMALNALVWKTRQPGFDDLFMKLRDFALEHREAAAIMRAIG